MSFLNKSLILVAFISLFLVLKPFQNYSAKLREELPQIIPPPLSEEENSSEKINPKKEKESKKNKEDQSQTSANKTNNSESESKKEGEKEKKDQNQPNLQSSFSPSSSPSSPPPDIVSELPRGEFISPKPNDTLTNQVFISFKIEKAQNVEFYLRIPSSLMPTYLGNAFFENGLWNYLWETTKTPNGHYFILAKITSEFGEYWGAKLPIQIKNLVAENLPEVEKIKEEVKQKKEEIETKIEKLNQEEEKTVKKVESAAQELKEKIEQPEIKPEIKEKIKEKTEVLKQESQKIIKNLANPQLERDQKQEIKQQLKSTLQKFNQEIVENLPAPSRKEFENKFTEVKQKIDEAALTAEQIAQEKKITEEQKTQELIKDSDNDGISDEEEIRLGTNPLLVDSDGDGFLDSSEIKLGFDPLNPSPAAKIEYQDPRKVNLPPSPELKIEKIETVELPNKNYRALKISGKAIPNSFVTLYIFSLPTIVITKADSSGRWEYILDKSLSEGQHTAFIALTNNLGQIEKKSEAVDFVKRNNEILRLFDQRENMKPVSLVDKLQWSFFFLVIALIVFGVGVAFLIIGLTLSAKAKMGKNDL
jgi:hypothetical protein